jgi:hypothetical protein
VSGHGSVPPLEVDAGADTPVWLATGTGAFFQRHRVRPNPAAYRTDLQDALVEQCTTLTGARLRSLP